MVVLSRAAKEYKAEVHRRALDHGITAPITGRVSVTVGIYPAMPKDATRRMRSDPTTWDDSVRAIDLDNSIKIILDAIQGVLIHDDRWVRKIVAERHRPTGEAHATVTVEPIGQEE